MNVMTLLKKLKYRKLLCMLSLIIAMLASVVINVGAERPTKARRGVIRRSIQDTVPQGYTQLEGTQLFYSRKMGGVYVGSLSVGSIDLIGKFGDSYYSSTYGDFGYVVALKVDDYDASFADCLNGSTHNGVSFRADIEPQGEMARMYYTLTNTNDSDVHISLGAYDDVYVGNNIAASITRKKDSRGETYGISLADGEGAQLCVLFGAGLTGVSGVDDFWFGSYSINATAEAVACNYSSGENYMVENGNYDCGIGWGWKNRLIKAGQTVVFSYLIAIGDVNLEPNSSFEVTPEDPEGWNDLSRLHVLTLEGGYESPAGLAGMVEYAVEDNNEWIALTDTLVSGSTFTGEVRAMFNPELSTHTIRFRTVDQVGNTTLLPSIVYPDVAYHTVSGIMDKTYTGDSIFQTELTCNLSSDQYTTKNYHNNVHAGTASFNFEGVFPYTIGRKTYTFTINPQTLTGELALADTNFVYTGYTITPDWQFTNANYANLQSGSDYSASWTNNRLPGTGTLTVTGKGNYTGSLSANINIDKAQLRDNLFTLTLPDEDITYDEQSHGASINTANGVGQPTITYLKQGETEASAVQPTEAGDYTIYLAFADGSLYYGRENSQVGTFSIYEFNADEWAILQTLLPQLTEMGWSQPWDVSLGMKGVSSLQGLIIEKGHVTGLDLVGQNLTGTFPAFILDLPQLQSLNLADNHLSGNLGQCASSMTNLTSLNVAGNSFDEVTPMLPSSLINVNLGRQAINHIVELPLSSLSSDYLVNQVPNILLYNHAQQSYSTNIRLLCSTEDESWSTNLVSQNGQVTLSAATTDNAYRGQSGDILNVVLLNNNGTREGSTFQIRLNFEQGDGNFDGSVNVLDLQTTLNYMFEEYTAKPYNFTASNLWADDVINVQDAVCLVNLLLDSEVPTARLANQARQTSPASDNFEASVFIENGQLYINTVIPISAFDMVISTSQKCELLPALSQMGFTCKIKQKGNQVHLIGYSLNGMTLPTGMTAICKLSEGTIDYIMLSDDEAQEIKCETRETTTDIHTSGIKNPSGKEVFRIPLGTKHAISINANGKKMMIKNEK